MRVALNLKISIRHIGSVIKGFGKFQDMTSYFHYWHDFEVISGDMNIINNKMTLKIMHAQGIFQLLTIFERART